MSITLDDLQNKAAFADAVLALAGEMNIKLPRKPRKVRKPRAAKVAAVAPAKKAAAKPGPITPRRPILAAQDDEE